MSSCAARLERGLHIRANYVDRGCTQVLYPLAEVFALADSWGVVEDKGREVSPELLAGFYVLAIELYHSDFRDRGGLFNRSVEWEVAPKRNS